MSESVFVIPSRDDDLYHVSESFYVEKKDDVTDEDIESNLTDFNASINEWWNILEYFNHFFYTIGKPNLVSKQTLHASTKAIYKALSKITDLIPTTLQDLSTDDEGEIDDRVQLTKDRIRYSLLPYTYLLCRLATVCENEAVKSTATDKRSKNAAKDEFSERVAKLRKDIVELLERLVTMTDDKKYSSVKAILAPDSLPPGFPRTINQYLFKLLSLPENALVRSEVRQLYSPIFHILGFMAFEWKCTRSIVESLIEKIAKAEYFKKVTTFIFLTPILELKRVYADNLVDAMLVHFKNSGADRIFSIFTTTIAEKMPEFIVKNFSTYYDLLAEELNPGVRASIFTGMQAIMEFYFRQDSYEEHKDFLFSIFMELQLYFDDMSSGNIRSKLATITSHIACENYLDDDSKEVKGDRSKRRFPVDYYAFNFVGKYAILMTDHLVTVRRAALVAAAEVVHRNPFGPDLDYNKLYLKYVQTGEALKALEQEPDGDDEILAKLNEKYVKIKAVVSEGIEAYFEASDFPDKTYDTPSDDEILAYFTSLFSEFESTELTKDIVIKAADYCFEHHLIDMNEENIEEIVDFIAEKFHLKNITAIEITNREDCIAEERRLQKKRKRIELETEERRHLCGCQLALQLEACMKNAIQALKNAEINEINDIVKLLSVCRQFKLRGSESAVMQICSLIYRNDPEIRKFVVTAGKEIFFSSNEDENVSEKSTVQNLMQVLLNAKLEDRCILSDTLVHIFKNEDLKPGSLNFLFETAIRGTLDLAIVAVQILQPYIKAYPNEGRKRFGEFVELLKRKNESFRIEVLRLASCCATVLDTTADLKDHLIPRFRLSSNDEFFKEAFRQLLEQLGYLESKSWNERAKLTIQVIYDICETPDNLFHEMIGPILNRAKVVNYDFRAFRDVYFKILKSLQDARQKLRENKVDILPVFSTIDDFEQILFEIENNVERMNMADDNLMETTFNNDDANVLVMVDPRQPETSKKLESFLQEKRKSSDYYATLHDELPMKWLEKHEMVENFKDLLEISDKVSAKSIHRLYQQAQLLFIKTNELQRQWHTLLERIFYLTQFYITRTVQFTHDAMNGGLEIINKTLNELRSMPAGKLKMMNLPLWEGEYLSAFEKDNLLETSIFKVHKNRMADATEQSIDGIVASQMDSAIGYDLFRPGSILMRVWPLLMQTLRFHSRSLISSELADAAIFCLLKYMYASPNQCRRYLSYVFSYLRTAKPETRSNMIIMLADIAIRQPSTFSKRFDHFMYIIFDNSPHVRYTALLMIYYLCTMKAIQLSEDNRAHVAMLIIDPNDYISDMAKYFFVEGVQNHQMIASAVINDVLTRMYALETKEFDFVPITNFFFSLLTESVKDSEATMEVIVQLLITAAKDEAHNEYSRNFAVLLIGCIKLIPKISDKALRKLVNGLLKFKVFLRKRDFRKALLILVDVDLKRLHDPNVTNLKEKIEEYTISVKKAEKYERTVIAKMNPKKIRKRCSATSDGTPLHESMEVDNEE